MVMRVFIGQDSRELEAYDVAAATLLRHSNLYAEPLDDRSLRTQGLLWRPMLRQGNKLHDLISGVDQSTEFAQSRFLVPLLCRSGPALFVDCDVVILRNVTAMMTHCVGSNANKAVWVVKHHGLEWPKQKMDGQTQRIYPSKGWSSVMLFNCSHPAHRRLTLHDVNTRHRDDLHAFYWLHDDEIGQIPVQWNWLVGVAPKPENPGIAHFTLGGPWLPGWVPREHDEIWLKARREL
jgi:hypothetical protein